MYDDDVGTRRAGEREVQRMSIERRLFRSMDCDNGGVRSVGTEQICTAL
jgi:hypothetical protein